VHPPEVREHPWAHALRCPSLTRTHLYRNLPYNQICDIENLLSFSTEKKDKILELKPEEEHFSRNFPIFLTKKHINCCAKINDC
jgi:hypothetical protein